MATISSLGIGSGLDLNNLVQGLVAAERDPVLARLDSREALLQAELSAFGSLKSALSGLQDSLTELSEVGAGRRATSGDKDLLSASAADSAAVGSYDIEVSQLAKAHSLASLSFSDPTDTVGTGTLTFTFGTTDYKPNNDKYDGFVANPDKSPQSIVIDTSNNTLEGVRDAINDADFGVNAVIVNDGSGYRLLLTSEDTGAANSLQISAADDDGDDSDASGLSVLSFDGSSTHLEQTVEAKDAALKINGLDVTSDSNTLTEAIPGLTLDILGTTGTDPVTVDVNLDKRAVTNAVDSFVESYNSLVGQIQDLTRYNPDTQDAGLLLGDSTLRGLVSRLSGGLIETADAAIGGYRNLVDLGITTGEGGKLSLDSDTLDAALASDFEGVVGLLNEAAENQESTAATYLGSEGLLSARTDGIQARIDDISDQRIALDERLTILEARLVKQFTGLDTLVSQLQSTGNFLFEQLANIPVPGQGNS